MRRLLLFVVGMLGCSASSPPLPRAAVPPGPVAHVTGTVAAIRFHNVAKAAGHYHYNVELELLDATVVPPPAVVADGPLAVRLPDRLSWSSLSRAEQAALSPDGPRHTLAPSTWAGFHVGQTVTLAVVFSSPGLAHLVLEPAPP